MHLHGGGETDSGSGKGKNPIDFINRTEIKDIEHYSVYERTKFLRDYALENDIPFIVFGN